MLETVSWRGCFVDRSPSPFWLVEQSILLAIVPASRSRLQWHHCRHRCVGANGCSGSSRTSHHRGGRTLHGQERLDPEVCSARAPQGRSHTASAGVAGSCWGRVLAGTQDMFASAQSGAAQISVFAVRTTPVWAITDRSPSLCEWWRSPVTRDQVLSAKQVRSLPKMGSFSPLAIVNFEH